MYLKHSMLWTFFLLLCGAFLSAQDFNFNYEKGKGVQDISFQGGSGLDQRGFIQIPAKGTIAIPALSKWNVTQQGFTCIVTLRCDGVHNAVLFGKEGVFETRVSFDVETAIVAANAAESRTVPWHCRVPVGKYVQIALTLKYISYTPSGEVGYRATCFVNDEIVAQTMLHNLNPATGDGAFHIGGGNFSGTIVKIDFMGEAFSDGKVMELARSNPWLKAALDIPEAVVQALRPAAKDTARTKWLKNALSRSLADGASLDKVLAAAKALEAGVSDFNAVQGGYVLVESEKAAWLISRRGGGEAVLVAMFDPRTGRDVSGKRMLRWKLQTSEGIISDATPGVASEISNFAQDSGITEFDIEWNYRQLQVLSHVVLMDARLEADLQVRNNEPDLLLNEVCYPCFDINPPASDAKKNHEVLTDYCGRDIPCALYGSYINGLYYPAHISMQFAALYDEDLRNGIYFAFEESEPVCKTTGRGGVNGEYCYEYQTAVPYAVDEKGGNSYQSRGPAVIELYHGRWFEAGQVYKRFLRERSSWFVHDLPRKDTPEWYRDNPFWIVQGDLEEMLYLRKYLEVPFALDTTGFWYAMGEDNTPDASRMVKMVNCGDRKPLGPEKAAAQLKKLHDAGIYVRPYLNVRLWDFCQYHSVIHKIEPDRSEKSRQLAVKNYDGTIHEEPYGFKYYVICPYTQEWKDILYDNMKFIAECGFDGVYLDQSIGCRFIHCYDPSHGHALRSPYIWQPEYFKVLDKVRTELREKYPTFTMDGEGASEVWMSHMDGYQCWEFPYANGRIPLQQSIYGGGRIQFVARGTEAYGGCGSWNAFFCRMAEQFVNSEQLGWIHINDFRFGTGRRKFTKKLCQLRWALTDYFNQADMLAPLEFKTAMPKFSNAWGLGPTVYHNTDKILHAVWQRIDGKIMIPFVNTANETVAIQPILPWSGKLTICSEGTGEVAVCSTDEAPELKLGPHETQIWFVHCDGGVEPNARHLADVMCRFPDFDDGEVLSYRQDYAKEAKVEVKVDQWIRACDVSWTALAFHEKEVTVNFVKQGSPENTAGWIVGKSGGIAYFGEFDFGAARPRFVEIEVSSAETGVAGGTLRLMDLTGAGFPEKSLAEVTIPAMPKPFDFEVVRVPLDPEVYGKRRLAWCFEKPAIIRRWRIVE